MSKTLTVLGAGGWGWNWTDRALRDPAWDVLAIADANPTVLKQLKDRGVPDHRLFNNADDALAAARSDAVTCSVPNPHRVPLLLRALEEGRHVLVDKPLVHTAAAVNALLERGRGRSTVFMVAQNYRFFAGARRVKELVSGGSLGPVGAMHVHFLRHMPSIATTFLKDLPGFLPLGMEMCIHHFDMMRFFLDADPVRVSGVGWRNPWSQGVGYDALAAQVEFPGGVQVAYDANWGTAHNATDWNGHWEVVARNGTVSYGHAGRGLHVFDTEARPVQEDAGLSGQADTVQSLDHVWAQFSAAVNAGAGPGEGFCPLEDNVRSIGMALALAEAVETRAPVEVAAFAANNGWQ